MATATATATRTPLRYYGVNYALTFLDEHDGAYRAQTESDLLFAATNSIRGYHDVYSSVQGDLLLISVRFYACGTARATTKANLMLDVLASEVPVTRSKVYLAP